MIYEFGDFELDEERWELRQRGRVVEVPPKAMETLAFLVRHRERVVQKEELFAELWPGVSVTDASLMKSIRITRQILGDDGDAQRVIKTVRGRGYRFVAPVHTKDHAVALPPVAAPVRRSVPSPTRELLLDRERELMDLGTALERAMAGQTLGVLLSGDAGIGKTRLAEELAVNAEERGMSVVWGRCCEEGGAPELRPWIQILEHLFKLETGSDELTRHEAMARLFPERGRAAGVAWPLLRTEPERFRAFDAIAQYLRRAAQRTPLVLILEDLHAADAASLLLAHFLLREIRGAPLFVLGTYRPAELDREASTPGLFSKLLRETGAIELSGLSESGIRQLLDGASPGRYADAKIISQVRRVTEGNPLFVSELVRLLSGAGAGELSQSSGGADELRVPERIVEALRGRFESLPAPTRELLANSAVIGRQFELPLLRALCALEERELLERLQPAFERKVVAPVAGSRGAFQFTHILFRDVFYEGLDIGRRAELHGRVAALIESFVSGADEPPAAILAHHFLRAALGGGSREGAQYSLTAGRQALASFAFEEAALHFERALGALRYERDSEGLVGECWLSLGHAQRLSGDYAAAASSFDRALASARKIADPVALAKAALGFAQVKPEMGTVNKDVIERLQEAVEALRLGADTALPVLRELRTLALARLGLCLWFGLRTEEAERLTRESLTLARALEEPATLSHSLLMRHWVLWHPSQAAERLSISNELIELERQRRSPAMPEARLCHIFDLLELGRREALGRAIGAYDDLAQKLRDPLAIWNARVLHSMQALLEGRFAEAEASARETLQLGLKIHELNARIYFMAQLFWIRCEEGRPRELEQSKSERGFLTHNERLRLRCEAGDEAGTRELLEKVAKGTFGDLPRDWSWLPALAHVAAACALVGDATRGAQVQEILAPYAALHVVLGPAAAYLGPVSLYLGFCARARSHHEEAIDWGERALADSIRLGARPTAARAYLHLAESFMRRATAGDRGRAADAAARALSLSRELGMGQIERLAAVVDSRLREPPSSRPAHSRP
ncbi:MAG TPA: AAA family ATPase [Polyangiaceae bacterium]|jgi:DNA-binding winged helix-turn-helix (wHTH) protein/tetratricopeptide (TPR) repeat protein|nr:AAA family ATPase [Polyangiaceae bacterium]